MLVGSAPLLIPIVVVIQAPESLFGYSTIPYSHAGASPSLNAVEQNPRLNDGVGGDGSEGKLGECVAVIGGVVVGTTTTMMVRAVMDVEAVAVLLRSWGLMKVARGRSRGVDEGCWRRDWLEAGDVVEYWKGAVEREMKRACK